MIFSDGRKLTRINLLPDRQCQTPGKSDCFLILDIKIPANRLQDHYPHHPSGASILEAVNAGCRVCKIVWYRICEDARLGVLNGYKDGWLHEPSMTGSIWYSIIARESAANYNIYFQYGFEDGQTPMDDFGDCAPANTIGKTVLLLADRDIKTGKFSVFSMTCQPDKKAGIQSLQDIIELGRSTKSDVTWSLALKWLHECRTRHTRCSTTPTTVPWLPTRLIYVGTAQVPALHLHITDGATSAEPYVSLSHCWGKIQIKRLLKADIKSMIEYIEIKELPKTFQDAIVITRKLGVQYLWIDSLCIIQDSVEDWQSEALTMEDVYKNAQLNIAATGSADGNGGCFVTRDPLLVQSIYIHASWNWAPGNYRISNSAVWRHGVNRAPLNTRAWVMQERVLAARTLHFGSEQVYWECNEKNACETFPDGVPLSLIDETGTPRIQTTEHSGTYGARLRCFSEEWFGLLKPDPAMRYYDIWSNMIEAYSRCHLTHGTDILIAISGVVKQLQGLLHDEYFAGIWKSHLPYHLLWFKERPSPTRRPIDIQDYRAPSWSWASIDGEITDYPISNMEGAKILIEVLEVQSHTVNADPTSQCTGGLLRLRAFLKPAKWEKVGGDELYFLIFGSEGSEGSGGSGSSGDGIYEGIYQSIAFPDYIDISQSPDIFCVPIHTFELNDEESRTYGLILEGSGEGGNVFRRVGQFKSEFDDCRIFDQAMLQRQDIIII
jgi:hypothetical protein